MAIDYAALLATATGTIKDMGQPAMLSPINGGSDIPVTALVSDYGVREREGQLIGRDDRRALIAAEAGVEPDSDLHRLVIGGTVLRIVSVRPLRPAGTTLYFDCQVRK